MKFQEIEENVTKKNNEGVYMGLFGLEMSDLHNMSKAELIRIMKELDYAVYEIVSKDTYNDIQELALKNLKEWIG